MKKILLMISTFLYLSCSNDDNSSSSGVYKWSFKLDGVLYEWQGNHLINPNSGGQSTYSTNSIALQKTDSNNSPTITVGAIFPNASVGNFTFNSSNSSTSNAFFISFSNGIMYSTQFGGTINVNISSLSGNTFQSNPANPGKVIGTFSGTVKRSNGSTASISDGSFEAVRGS